jgi:hypothetical protein
VVNYGTKMTEQTNRTVFVVGAGASHEFGLPVGTTLQDQISHQTKLNVQNSSISAFSHNGAFVDSLPAAVGLQRYTAHDRLRLARKSLHISAGVKHAASIDNYLHAQRSDAELVAIGKLAIATCILRAEQDSSLAYSANGVGFKGRQSSALKTEPHNSWLGLLVKALSAGRNFTAFCKALETITFVCFNYDRCIERYFHVAVSLIYPDIEFNISELENALNIIHPYGSLGVLAHEQGVHGTFGKIADSNFLILAAQGIRTFTEGMESDVRVRIGNAFSGAKSAIFLGYGFISVNDRFLFDESPFEIRTVLGTSYGISDERSASVAERLMSTCMMWDTPHDGWQQRGHPQLRNEGCADLLQRFSHLVEEIGR